MADELLSSIKGRGSVRAHGVYMSFDNLYVTVASSAEEAGRAFAALYASLTPEKRGQFESNLSTVSYGAAQSPSDAGSAAGGGAGFSYADMCCPPMVTRRLANSASAPPQVPERFAELWRRWSEVKKAFVAPSTRECLCGPDTYLPYFGDAFKPPPPPALPVAATRRHRAATSFSPLALAAMLPTHFVPVEALLKQLPTGYTFEHVRCVFGETMALEMVELADKTYVRFYGGKDGEGFAQRERTASVCVDEGAQASAHDGNNGGDVDDDEEPAASGTSALAPHSGDAVHQCIAAYEPNPYLFFSFLPRFPRPFQWIPLYAVVEHAPPAVKAALLPLRQRSTLLYFAQQQHRMQFTSQNDGAICLSFPPVRSLRAETTPLPRELAEVQRLLQIRGLVYVSEMEAGLAHRISDGAKRSIIAYFGTLRRFLYQHERVFRLSVVPNTNRRSSGTTTVTPPAAMPRSSAPTLAGAVTQEPTHEVSHEAITPSVASSASGTAGTLYPPPSPTRRGFGFAIEVPPISTDAEDDAVSTAMLLGKGIGALDANGFPHWLASADLAVMCEGHAMMQQRSGVSPEQRLQTASRQRRSSQKIRRRMALTANPNSPYTDPEVLLDTILRYLPPTQHIGLRSLLQALPPAITDFLPTDPIRLFRNAPTKVHLFEFRERNNIRVMRPGLPLPDGRLRSSYTVDELLHILAAELPSGRSRTSIDLFGRLPYGARETIRLQHRHLIDLVEQYPQYFLVVFADAESAKKSLARVQLIRSPPPTTTLSDDEWDAKTTTVLDDMTQAAEREDHAILMAELPPSFRETLNLKPMP